MTVIGMTPKPAPSPVDELTQPTIVEYPDSDGEPMGETGLHVRASMALYGALYVLFQLRGWRNFYIAADMFLYYEEGNPRAQKAPDVMVIKGVDGTYERRSFKIWEEGAAPTVIFEITSKSTWTEDLLNKSELYKRLGVKEYFIFDPLAEFLTDPFQGARLEDGQYVKLEADVVGTLWSAELEVKLRRDGELLRVIDPTTDEVVPVLEEGALIIAAAEQRADQEAIRAEQEARRARQEAIRAEKEATRAEQEAQRADAAESEIQRLQAMIDQLQKESD